LTEPPKLLQLAAGRHSGCLWVEPVYHERAYKEALPDVRLLPEVVDALFRVAERLRAGHGLGLLVWDGWRPLELQGRLWEEYRRELALATDLEGEALDARTRLFVSPPEDAGAPPHSTGRAVDLTLCSLVGEPLDMGGEFDELTERSVGDRYERPDLTEEETAYRDRRRLLREAMEVEAFRRLPSEWWHFEREQE